MKSERMISWLTLTWAFREWVMTTGQADAEVLGKGDVITENC